MINRACTVIETRSERDKVVLLLIGTSLKKLECNQIEILCCVAVESGVKLTVIRDFMILLF